MSACGEPGCRDGIVMRLNDGTKDGPLKWREPCPRCTARLPVSSAATFFEDARAHFGGPPGIDAWAKPWVDCPCGSEDHQRGGHPKELIYRTKVTFDDGHTEVAELFLTHAPYTAIVRID